MPRSQQRTARYLCLLLPLLLTACGGNGTGSETDPAQPQDSLDDRLAVALSDELISGDAAFNRDLPSIDSPAAQLGMRLFFAKSLSGDMDVACVSCHHPVLGGADALTLPVGVEALDPDLLGLGRIHGPSGISNVPRNSPTVFNTGLWDKSMFWDSRVESFAGTDLANGAGSDIRTPDVAFGAADTAAGLNLPTAQARFPVTSHEEMRGELFEAGNTNVDVRTHLAARLGGYGVGAGELSTNNWLADFQSAFGPGDAQTLITYDNIAFALSEYERSMVFTSNPFVDYLNGDTTALTDQQKEGAILFFTAASEGGADCSNCHSGDAFTDGEHHIVAYPQFGPGKGDLNDDDFGRERETGDPADRYRFRTPSLLNVELTAPYGHAGAYSSLAQVVQHYNDPAATVNGFFDDGAACSLTQYEELADCSNLFPASRDNSQAALAKLADERAQGSAEFDEVQINPTERDAIVAFLSALTDPCTLDRDCVLPWIADPSSAGPDGTQLNGYDENGTPL